MTETAHHVTDIKSNCIGCVAGTCIEPTCDDQADACVDCMGGVAYNGDTCVNVTFVLC